MASLIERAQTIDILADDLTVLLDTAARLGRLELATITQILSKRGIKVHILRKYGESRRKLHALRQRVMETERLEKAKTPTADYECLR